MCPQLLLERLSGITQMEREPYTLSCALVTGLATALVKTQRFSPALDPAHKVAWGVVQTGLCFTGNSVWSFCGLKWIARDACPWASDLYPLNTYLCRPNECSSQLFYAIS